jgi:hypothetical protein
MVGGKAGFLLRKIKEEIRTPALGIERDEFAGVGVTVSAHQRQSAGALSNDSRIGDRVAVRPQKRSVASAVAAAALSVKLART